MSKPRYNVLFEPAEEGGYVVTCSALPGLVTEAILTKKPTSGLSKPLKVIWKACKRTVCLFPLAKSSPTHRSRITKSGKPEFPLLW